MSVILEVEHVTTYRYAKPVTFGLHRVAFHPRAALETLAIPQTEREQVWPLFWRHRGGFFTAHCRCHPDGRNDWTVEQSNPAPAR